MDKGMSFIATGDSFITRRLPEKNAGFQQLCSLLRLAEVRFTNLEVTVHDVEGYPSAVSGGTWGIASPVVLEDIKDYGFNLIAWANNHTLDYSYGGLEATQRYLNAHRLTHAGVGKNLAQASSPKYLECPSGRVALVAATSTFHDCWIAGEQRPDIIGRPGINPLRYETIYTVSSDQLKQLKSIAEATNINAEYELALKEGFSVKDENDKTFMFGKLKFVVGEKAGVSTIPNKQDVKRILRSISEAKRRADYVLVSIHSHEMEGVDKDKPAQFLINFAKSCIDGGADAVIGHGPHIIRGIEIYQGKPIFYSLGNFIFQNETVPYLPADFYEKYGLDHYHNVADAFDKRSDCNTKGLGVNPLVWESIIPYWEMQGGKLKEITLYPIELGYGLPGYQRGWPVLSQNTEILGRLRELSAAYNTRVEIDQNHAVGRIKLSNHT